MLMLRQHDHNIGKKTFLRQKGAFFFFILQTARQRLNYTAATNEDIQSTQYAVNDETPDDAAHHP